MAKRDKVALFLILDLLWQEERRRQEPELRLGWSAAWLAWAAAEPACLATVQPSVPRDSFDESALLFAQVWALK